MGDRSVIGKIFFVQIIFLQKRNDGRKLELFGKDTRIRERLTMLVMVGRSIGRHCLSIDVGIGSRSQKVFDD